MCVLSPAEESLSCTLATVHDSRTYERIMRDGTVGVGESFTEGWWDCDRLDQMIDRAVRGNLYDLLGKSWTMRAQVVRSRTGSLCSIATKKSLAQYPLSPACWD